MELILKVVLIVVGFLSGVVYMVCMFMAYENRADKSFWGGHNILQSWWLLFPYGKRGVSNEAKEIVFWARVSWFVCIASIWIAVEI